VIVHFVDIGGIVRVRVMVLNTTFNNISVISFVELLTIII